MEVFENPNTALEAIGENNIIESKYSYLAVNSQQIIVQGSNEMRFKTNR